MCDSKYEKSIGIFNNETPLATLHSDFQEPFLQLSFQMLYGEQYLADRMYTCFETSSGSVLPTKM